MLQHSLKLCWIWCRLVLFQHSLGLLSQFHWLKWDLIPGRHALDWAVKLPSYTNSPESKSHWDLLLSRHVYSIMLLWYLISVKTISVKKNYSRGIIQKWLYTVQQLHFGDRFVFIACWTQFRFSTEWISSNYLLSTISFKWVVKGLTSVTSELFWIHIPVYQGHEFMCNFSFCFVVVLCGFFVFFMKRIKRVLHLNWEAVFKSPVRQKNTEWLIQTH